jgi:hypothetical protein
MLEHMHATTQLTRTVENSNWITPFSIVTLFEDIRLSCTMTQLKCGKRERIIDLLLTDCFLTFVALCPQASTEYRVAI